MMFHGQTRGVVRVSCLLLVVASLGLGETPSRTNQSQPFLQDSLRKELIKVQILQRLGLSEKPIVDLSHKISRDLVLETLRRTEGVLDFENQLSIVGAEPRRENASEDQDSATVTTNYAKTSEIISFPEKGPVMNDQTLLSFSFAGNNAFGVGVRVRKANLWVKMNYVSSLGPEFGHVLYPNGVRLFVIQILGNVSLLPQPPTPLRLQDVPYEVIVSRIIQIDSLGWQKLDVTSVVQKWYSKLIRHRIRHPHNNSHNRDRSNAKLTLLIDCNGCGTSVKPVIFSSSSLSMSTPFDTLDSHENLAEESSRPHPADSMTEMPFLVLETETAQNMKRNRRRTLECNPRVKQCCKQRFFISFQDLGWEDWIIAPRGYYANYCRGHCGGVHRTPDTFLNYHTHVMEEYRRTAAGQMELNNLAPCCAPTKFSSVSLIYFGPDLNIIKRDLPKMVIEECGCP